MKGKRFVTIVSDQKGGFSFHTSWKTACETYDWEYEKSIPKEKEGHAIKKAPFDVQIKCLELVEFIQRANITQTYSKEDGKYVFQISGYDTEYWVHCDWTTRHEEAEYHHGDRGVEQMYGASEWVEITSVEKIELIDDDGGHEIKFDPWTQKQVFDYLEISERLD